jgi:phage terminase large subunit
MRVVEELYRTNHTLEQLKDEVMRMRERYNIEAFLADPSRPDLIATMRSWGLNTKEANNDVMTGIMEVQSRLKAQPDGRPRLTISKHCIHTIEEFSQYRYPEGRKDRNPDERPVKLYDHAMDALRYAAMSLRRTSNASRFANVVSAKRGW